MDSSNGSTRGAPIYLNPVQTYELELDDDSGGYFMEIFVGSEMDRRLLLLDTQANGTAIRYNEGMSKTFKNYDDKTSVESIAIGGFMRGTKVTDKICLDKSGNICINDYMFTMITDFNYNQIEDMNWSGIMPFNQYGVSENSKARLVYDLYKEHVFAQKTLQLDFNLESVTVDDQDIWLPSLITFNGIDERNYRHSKFPNDDPGFLMEKNLIKDGKWLISMEDASISNYKIFKSVNKNQQCNAVIATALNSIKLPYNDFQALGRGLNQIHSDINIHQKHRTSSGADLRIIGEKLCSHYDVGMLTFKIGGRYYKIPQLFFTTEIEDSKCLFMFELNNEYNKTADDIVTDQGVKDVDTNNGYILGTPFLRAFLILLDFEDNTIGFASKLNNYGAFITGNAEDDVAPYTPPNNQIIDNNTNPQRNQHINNMNDNQPTVDNNSNKPLETNSNSNTSPGNSNPQTEHNDSSKPSIVNEQHSQSTNASKAPDQMNTQTNTKKNTYEDHMKDYEEEDYKNQRNNAVLYIVIALVVAIFLALGALCYHCYKRNQEEKQIFAHDTKLRQENKINNQTVTKRKQQEELSQSFIERNNFAEF